MYHGERFNGYSHLLGLVLALLGSAYLLARIVGGGDVAKTVAALVFSASMIAMYGASTLCHSIRGRARLFWQRADHCAIYLLIAGTYTPVALVIDPQSRRLTTDDGGQIGTLSEATGIGYLVGQQESQQGGRVTIGFFPDGSSSGGDIVLSRGGAQYRVNVNWLTGAVTTTGGS